MERLDPLSGSNDLWSPGYNTDCTADEQLVATTAMPRDLHTIWKAGRAMWLDGQGDGLRISENANWSVPICSEDENGIE